MNLAPSMGAVSAFCSGGDAAGGLAWARAPEIISALNAADIIRLLTIVASKRVRSIKETTFLVAAKQRASAAHVPQVRNPVLRARSGRRSAKRLLANASLARGTKKEA